MHGLRRGPGSLAVDGPRSASPSSEGGRRGRGWRQGRAWARRTRRWGQHARPGRAPLPRLRLCLEVMEEAEGAAGACSEVEDGMGGDRAEAVCRPKDPLRHGRQNRAASRRRQPKQGRGQGLLEARHPG